METYTNSRSNLINSLYNSYFYQCIRELGKTFIFELSFQTSGCMIQRLCQVLEILEVLERHAAARYKRQSDN